ncbi:MAG TPA: hypothetical protein VLG27_00260 [Candidatus Saccharimonadia bacterium]|nr:hypothetical protein [Candidatus Saccharimonadia bacterium]
MSHKPRSKTNNQGSTEGMPNVSHDKKSPTYYRSLARQALESGNDILASRYQNFAKQLFESEEGRAVHIEEQVDLTVRKVQQLTEWGEQEVIRQTGPLEPGFGSSGPGKKGVLLFSAVHEDIAGATLSQVYQRLGVLEARLSAVPTHQRSSIPPGTVGDLPEGSTQDTYTYSFNTEWGVNLIEEQTRFAEGGFYYELHGSKPEDQPTPGRL